MNLTQTEYQSIIDSCPKEQLLAAWITEQAEKMVVLKKLGKELANQEAAEKTRHQQAIEEIKRRRELLQKQCRHLLVTCHPDPSGNSGSYETCDLCGAYL